MAARYRRRPIGRAGRFWTGESLIGCQGSLEGDIHLQFVAHDDDMRLLDCRGSQIVSRAACSLRDQHFKWFEEPVTKPFKVSP
jgi:hypothetical protein